jgi:hypothetical protein
MRFLTCTMRTDKAGRRSGSRASSSSRWCVTTSSALSAFTSSAYLRNRTRQTKQHSTTTGTVDHEKSHRAGRRWKWAQSASSKAGEISAGPEAAEHLVVHFEAAPLLVRPPSPSAGLGLLPLPLRRRVLHGHGYGSKTTTR